MNEEQVRKWLETHEPTADDIIRLCAESRNEGIDEIIEMLCEDFAISDVLWDYDHIKVVLQEAAERLKEQGE